jgi:hypothetical protein
VNQAIEISVLPGVGHQFGKQQAAGIERAARWLSEHLRA